MPRWIAFKAGEPEGFNAFVERGREACGGLFERPFVSWRDDVALLSRAKGARVGTPAPLLGIGTLSRPTDPRKQARAHSR
jgi:hypothetical protein